MDATIFVSRHIVMDEYNLSIEYINCSNELISITNSVLDKYYLPKSNRFIVSRESRDLLLSGCMILAPDMLLAS